MRIGIDLGGTKIEGIAIADDGTRAAAAADRGAARRLRQHARRGRRPRARHRSASSARAGTVGIGIPGAISPATGLVKNANSTWLNGRPLAEDLSRLLDRPIRFANDANCFALSEATDGAAAGAAVVFGVIVGTGTGGGVVDRRRVLTGANAIAGEWGHNPLPAPRDDESAGPAVLLRHAAAASRRSCRGPAWRATTRRRGPGITAEEIAARAAAGEALAIAALERYEERMARALGQRHQRARSRRHRAGRRAVEHRSPVRPRAAAVGAARVFRSRRPRGWCAPGTAIRAASAARRGCGSGPHERKSLDSRREP